MAIYDYKEFLTVDDVADYLRDKGLYNFNSSNNTDIFKLKSLLMQLVRDEKIRPAIYYQGALKALAWVVIENRNRYRNIGSCDAFFDGYLYIHESEYTDIAKYEKIKLEESKTNKILPNGEISTESYYHLGSALKIAKIIGCLSSDFDKFLNDSKDADFYFCNFPALPECQEIKFSDIFYQKSDFDTLFGINENQKPSIDKLQQRLQEAQARIKELESTQNSDVNNELKGLQKVNHDTERTRKFAQIIAKAIWDMDKTQAIRTNDMVQFLKPLIAQFEPSKLPDSDETVSYWLADIKPLHATKSGRPPKNELLEIPLTFKK